MLTFDNFNGDSKSFLKHEELHAIMAEGGDWWSRPESGNLCEAEAINAASVLCELT